MASQVQRACSDTLPWLISFSLDLMAAKLLFVTLATTMRLTSCATPIHVDGVLVTGERQDVSESDVRTAIVALKAALPELKAQTLIRIRVAAADEILLSYSSQRHAEATEYVVKRSQGRWKPTGEITI
jgi:hypothetical protein